MDESKLMALRLAREGFGSGDPQRILAMPTDMVLGAWELINFQSDYQESIIELNK